jgi:hypothetical protein
MSVVPAKAGIHTERKGTAVLTYRPRLLSMGSRFRGNDG